MKKFSIAAVALALCSGAASAADLPSHKAPPYIPPPPPPPPMWTGFYVGLNAGGAWGENNTVNIVSVPLAPGIEVVQLAALASAPVRVGSGGGFIGGGQIGYNWQFAGSFVAGVEADIQGIAHSSGAGRIVTAGIIAAPVITALSATKNVDYLGTVRGRVGWLFTPSLLVYGTGGLAYGGVNTGASLFQGSPGIFAAFGASSFSNTRVGWTAGGGFEWMFWPNWSAKVEYSYYDLGAVIHSAWLSDMTLVPPATYLFSQSSTRFNGHIVRAGVNYHFNWGAAPVIASY